jgi:hypothetical protein
MPLVRVADPDPAPHQSECESSLKTLSELSPPRLRFEHLKLLNFDFNAYPDLAFHCHMDPVTASQNNAEPDPQFGPVVLVPRRFNY